MGRRRQLPFALMRALDGRAGPPLVRLASLASQRPSAIPEEPREILVVKLLGIGSLALAEPAFRALRERYPRARITLVTFASHLGLVPSLSSLDRGLGIVQGSPLCFARSVIGALRGLRAAPPDIALDLETAHFSSLFLALSGARVRVGFAVPGWQTSRLLTHAVPYAEDAHASDRFLALAAAAGAPAPSDTTPRLAVAPGQDALCRRLGLPATGPLVAVNIHTGALCLERGWAVERFARLARRLLEELGAAVLLIGAPAEAQETAAAAARIGPHARLFNLAGRLTLPELVQLLSACELVISCDSGPAHLAAAAGTPTLALFGPESPARYGLSGRRQVNIYRPTPCSPCLTARNAKRAPCGGHNRCMLQITVEEVFDAAARRIGAPMRMLVRR